MSQSTETDIETVALEWLTGMGYTILPGSSIAPGTRTAERSDYDVVVLTGRLRVARVDIHPGLPESSIDKNDPRGAPDQEPTLATPRDILLPGLLSGCFSTSERETNGARL